jgi:hypothetical protein
VIRGQLWRALTALAVAAAWTALTYGLYFSTSDPQAWDDLEGGGRFAANFAVYWPHFCMTLAVATVVIVGVLPIPTRLSPQRARLRATRVVIALVVTMVVVALFASWVLSQEYLIEPSPSYPLVPQPELAAYAQLCRRIDVGAVVPLTGAVAPLIAAWMRPRQQQ